MIEPWMWAPYSKVKEAAEELKALIRARFPDAEFRLVRAEDSRRAWHLLAMVEGDPHEDVRALVVDREVDLLAKEHVPIYVIPLGREPMAMVAPTAIRKTG